MKSIITKIFIIFMIIVFCFSSYAILEEHHEKMKFDINKISGRPCLDPSSVLRGALSRNNWNELQLSQKFREKYKSKYDIIPSINDYGRIGNGYDVYKGKRVLMIDADSKGSFFDLKGENIVTTIFYFDYKITDDNLLDDITLLGSKKVDGVIGKEIIE